MDWIGFVTTIGFGGLLGIVAKHFLDKGKEAEALQKEILKERITKLLLPLYLELDFDARDTELIVGMHPDPQDFLTERNKEMVKRIKNIIKDNFYLADADLHQACFAILEFNPGWSRTDDEAIDGNLAQLKRVVDKQYFEAKRQYLGLGR